MTLICDAGALVAAERGDTAMWERLSTARAEQRPPLTHAGVVGQVWRGGTGRQTLLARALAGIHVLPIDEELGRAVGLLLQATETADVVDAAVVLLARKGDVLVTSDPHDMHRLATAAGQDMDVVPV